MAQDREWKRQERAAWWVKYALAVGAGLAGTQGVTEIVSIYAERSGLETRDAAKTAHEALKSEQEANIQRLEAKIDRLGDRIDQALLRVPR